MAQVTLSHDFQVAIPEEIRRSVPLKAGQQIRVDVQNGVITLVPSAIPEPSKSDAIRSLFGSWNDEDLTDDPHEIEERRQDLESFKKTMNANRPSERPI